MDAQPPTACTFRIKKLRAPTPNLSCILIQANILAKIKPQVSIERRKRAKSQPELKRSLDFEDLEPERKRFKSMEIERQKPINTPQPPSKPKNEIQSKTKKFDDENKEDSYFELIEEPTVCKKISMEERGDAFVLLFKPGEKPFVMKFDNHVLPDELCVTV